MKKLYPFILLMTIAQLANAQFKFYYSEKVKFLKPGNDTMKHAFTGGMNAPQFSNIDLNDDGVMDLFVFDRTSAKVHTYLKTPQGFIHTPQYSGRFPNMANWALLRDMDGDGKMDICTDVTLNKAELPDTTTQTYPGSLRVLRNISTTSGGLRFKQTRNLEVDTGGPFFRRNIDVNIDNVPCIDDIDGDGDADILVFKASSVTLSYFENYAKNKQGIVYPKDSSRFIYRDKCWGYTMYDYTFQTNGFLLNKSYSDQVIHGCDWRNYSNKHSGAHSANTMAMLDYNGDGVMDFVYGDGSYNNLVLLLNGRNKNSLHRDSIVAQDTAFPSNTTPAQHIIYPAAYYVDIDGDGKKELVVSTNDLNAKSVNNVYIYQNTGTNSKPVFNYQGSSFWGYNETVDVGTRSVPVLVDIDNDGDKDLMIATNGDFDYTKNFNDRIVWYKNNPLPDGTSVFSMADTNFLRLSKDTPIISLHPAFADLNGDNKPDMIIGCDNGQLLYYVNQTSGSNISFELKTRNFAGIDVGSFSAPTLYDIDNDGDNDLFIGNRDGNIKYFANTGTAAAPVFSNTPTIDSLGKISMRDSTNTIYNIPDVTIYGYATPTLYDIDKNGKPELIVGSFSGKVYIYADISVQPNAVFRRYSKMFVDYSDSNNPRDIRFGKFAAPCIGLLDGDTLPDILVGNIAGGLQFFASKSSGPVNGVEEYESIKAQTYIYPNPASGFMVINHEEASVNSYEVYDLSGRKIMQGSMNPAHAETQIDTQELNPGVYIMRVSGAAFSATHKFMISR